MSEMGKITGGKGRKNCLANMVKGINVNSRDGLRK